MNIRCAALDRIEKNLVDETHHGCVFDVGAGNIFLLVFVRRNVEVFKIKVIVFEIPLRRVDGLNGLDDAFFEFVVLYNDWINS